MSRSKHYRPRTKRENAERVKAAAEKLNGGSVDSLDEALTLFVRYLDVLQHRVGNCPDCGTELQGGYDSRRGWTELGEGKWWCPECDSLVIAWDYLQVDDEERATLPPLPSTVQHRFECSHEEHESGTKDGQSAQDTRIQQVDTDTSGPVPDEW
jgi:hypothetical protein